MTPYSLYVSRDTPNCDNEATHIARGIVVSGLFASSDIAGNMPVALKQYAPWIKPNTHCIPTGQPAPMSMNSVNTVEAD